MIVYALLDTVVDDLWAIDGIAYTTLSRVNIAIHWLDLEYVEPGRYMIISTEISLSEWVNPTPTRERERKSS